MRLVIVTHPKHARELVYCLASFERFAIEPIRGLLITEHEHLSAIRAIAPAWCDVAEIPAPARDIPQGYYRQMAAKLFTPLICDDEKIVFTDDDTEAVAAWSSSEFFDHQGRARLWSIRSRISYWHAANESLFGPCRHNWQLRIPFAVRREALVDLCASPLAERSLAMWRNAEPLSEFALMGEWAWRESEREQRSVFAHDLSRHWTLGHRPRFRDWQGHRQDFRRKIRRL